MRVFLFLGAVALHATAQSPAQRFEAMVGKFGKPSGGFAFTGTLWLNQRKVGTCRLSARPDAIEGTRKDHWRVSQERKVGTTGDARFSREYAYLRRDFLGVKGGARGAGKTDVALWRLRGKEYTVLAGREMGRVASRGYATSSLDSAAALFARRALRHRAKGVYVAQGIRADLEHRRMVWMFRGEGDFCGKRAILVKCEIGDRMLTMAFSKSSRDLYGYSARGKQGTVWALKKDLLPPAK